MRSSTLNFRAVAPLLAGVVLCALASAVAVSMQKGWPIPGEPTESWLGDIVRMREILYEQQPRDRPTIWIIGGSNALFGTDSTVLADRTGYAVRNYALHGGLHINLLFSQIRGRVRAGDLVLAPIEWEALDRKVYNQFDYNNYLHHLSQSLNAPIDVIYVLCTSVPLKRWMTGVVHRVSYSVPSVQRWWSVLMGHQYVPYQPPNFWKQTTREQYVTGWRSRTGAEIYSFVALTPAGDFSFDKPATKEIWENKETFVVPSTIRPGGLASLDRWHDYFASIGAKLLVMAPVMLDSNSDHLRSRETWRRIELWRQEMAKTKAPFHCNPVEATYDRRYRFDTVYHLNAAGAHLRSEEVAKCVLDFLNGTDVRTRAIDPDEAVNQVEARLATQQFVDVLN